MDQLDEPRYYFGFGLITDGDFPPTGIFAGSGLFRIGCLHGCGFSVLCVGVGSMKWGGGDLLDFRAGQIGKVINAVSLCDRMARRSLKAFCLKPFVIC